MKPRAKGSGKGDDMPDSASGLALKSSAVRMSFKTERPFFPYREPADQRDAKAKDVKRLLRVYVAAKQRMAGKLGDGSTKWPGATVWANAVTEPERASLLTKVKLPGGHAPDLVAPDGVRGSLVAAARHRRGVFRVVCRSVGGGPATEHRGGVSRSVVASGGVRRRAAGDARLPVPARVVRGSCTTEGERQNWK